MEIDDETYFSNQETLQKGRCELPPETETGFAELDV